MLKEAYLHGFQTAIKQAQENGLLGKITGWAEDNPSMAAGLLGRPALETMQAVQEVDPEAARLRSVAQDVLNDSPRPPQQLVSDLLLDPTT
jgi:hypothetical protein